MRIPSIALALVCSATCIAQVKLPTNHRVAPPSATTAVGKAGGRAVTAAEVEPYLWEWFGKDAVEDVLSYVVISQEAGRRGIVVSDAEVEKKVDDTIKALQSNQSTTFDDATKTLLSQGFPRSRLFIRSKATMLLDKIILADFHPSDFVKVSTILVRTNTADASAVSKAIEKCQDAYKKLTSGQDWNTVFNSVTTDQKLLSTKGELGWRDLSLFPESVVQEINTLPDGGYTHPAMTQYGVQIFRVDAHGSNAKGKDLDFLRDQFVSAGRPKYIEQLKKQANAQVLLK